MSRRLGHDYTGFPDGIHPDEKGKKQIAEILADTILKAGPQSKEAWSLSFKGTMPHTAQGYTFQAPGLEFDPRGRFGDFVDIAVSGGEIKVTTATPVSILTPPLFPPDSPVAIEVVVAGAAKRVSVRTDAEGRLPFTTGPQACVIRLAGPRQS